MAEGRRASHPAPRSWDLSPPGTFLPLTLRVLPAASSSHRDGSAAWEQGWLLPCPPGKGGECSGKEGWDHGASVTQLGGAQPSQILPHGAKTRWALGAGEQWVLCPAPRSGEEQARCRSGRPGAAGQLALGSPCSAQLVFPPSPALSPAPSAPQGTGFLPRRSRTGLGATPVPWEPPRPPHGTGWVPAAPLAFAGCFFVPALPGAAGDPKSLPPPWPAQEGCPKPGLGWDLGVFPPSGWVRIGCNPARGGSPARGGGCLPPTSARAAARSPPGQLLSAPSPAGAGRGIFAP